MSAKPLLNKQRKFLPTHSLTISTAYRDLTLQVRRVKSCDGYEVYIRGDDAPRYVLHDGKLIHVETSERMKSWSLIPRTRGPSGKSQSHEEREAKAGPQVAWHMTRELYERIERARGTTPRKVWIEEACERRLEK